MIDDTLSRLARAVLLPAFAGDTAPRWLLEELERGLGGVTLFALNGNVSGTAELARLTADLRRVADPIVTIDEEGGDVTRLGGHRTASPYPGNAALGAVDDVELTRRVYRSLAAELAEVGVNLNFAPSVDVNAADDNPIIGVRAFGADPELVARHAAAAVTGTQEAGVAACAKHFPGHGATVEDSHLGVPLVDADVDLLERRELVPFRAALKADVRAVMTGHLNVPALTGGEPATLSHAVITGLLRGRLGFDGVVVTDALDMKGASGSIGIPEASVRALAAGADLLCLGPREQEDTTRATVAAIVAAVRDGRLAAERLEDAAERGRALRAWLAGAPSAGTDRPAALEAARRALTFSGELPDLPDPLVVELEAPGNIAVGPTPWGLGPWASDMVRVDGEAAAPGPLLERAAGRGLVIVVRDAHRHAGQRRLVNALLAARPDAVLVEMGLPVWRPEGRLAYLATYGATLANARAAAELLGLAAADAAGGGHGG